MAKSDDLIAESIVKLTVARDEWKRIAEKSLKENAKLREENTDLQCQLADNLVGPHVLTGLYERNEHPYGETAADVKHPLDERYASWPWSNQ